MEGRDIAPYDVTLQAADEREYQTKGKLFRTLNRGHVFSVMRIMTVTRTTHKALGVKAEPIACARTLGVASTHLAASRCRM